MISQKLATMAAQTVRMIEDFHMHAIQLASAAHSSPLAQDHHNNYDRPVELTTLLLSLQYRTSMAWPLSLSPLPHCLHCSASPPTRQSQQSSTPSPRACLLLPYSSHSICAMLHLPTISLTERYSLHTRTRPLPMEKLYVAASPT